MSILGAAQSIPNDDIAVTRMEEALKKTSSSYYMVVRDENGKLLKGFGQTSRASTPSVTSNDVRELARQILSNTNIAPQKGGTCDEHLSQGDECKGRTGPYEIIEDVSNGQLPCVCSVACVCNRGGDTGRVQLKPLLLRALIDMSKKYKFTVNSVTGGSHDSDDSHHYMGRAADVNPDQDLSEFLYNYPGIYDLYGPVQYLQANGDTLCVDNTHKPARCISGHQGHIHFSVVDDGQVQSSSVTTTTSSSVDIPLPGGKTGTFEMGL
jgi:hypothetical protein